MKRITTIIATSMLILTGCGNQQQAEPENTKTPETLEPFSEEWMELCDKNKGTDPENPKCWEDLGEDFDNFDGDAKIGEPVELKYYDNSETYTITVTNIEYKTEIKEAASNPEWDGGDDKPEHTTAKSVDGKKFVHITYTIENTGKLHAMPSFDYFAYTDDDAEHAQSSDDEEYTGNLNAQNSQIPYDGLNPGDKGTLEAVISIPQDKQANYIVIADPSIDMRGALTIKNEK